MLGSIAGLRSPTAFVCGTHVRCLTVMDGDTSARVETLRHRLIVECLTVRIRMQRAGGLAFHAVRDRHRACMLRLAWVATYGHLTVRDAVAVGKSDCVAHGLFPPQRLTRDRFSGRTAQLRRELRAALDDAKAMRFRVLAAILIAPRIVSALEL